MTQPVALVTGFEAYGGRGRNPAGEVAARLDGREIAGVRVIARNFPVAFGPLTELIPATLAETDPTLVISLGLCPGEPMIRLERVAINVADFEIPDNEGMVLVDQPVDAAGSAALLATLPLRPIQAALLQAGIPARLSSSAGTFLCNKTLYRFLGAIEQSGRAVPCGFIHLPYTPEQVAGMIAEMHSTRSIEQHRRPEIASMGLETMVEAVRIALEVTAQGLSAQALPARSPDP